MINSPRSPPRRSWPANPAARFRLEPRAEHDEAPRCAGGRLRIRDQGFAKLPVLGLGRLESMAVVYAVIRRGSHMLRGDSRTKTGDRGAARSRTR